MRARHTAEQVTAKESGVISTKRWLASADACDECLKIAKAYPDGIAIDKAFGIKLPLEQWTQQINDGQATTEQYFVLKNLCARIDELIAAKSTA